MGLALKGLSYSLPPKKLSYLVNFELFHTHIDNLQILSRDNLDYIKTKIKYLALTSFLHLSNEEFEALKYLSANFNLVIQKADKGNSVALVQNDLHIRHIENILDDATKFEKVKIKKGSLNFSINHEKRTNNLKSLEN